MCYGPEFTAINVREWLGRIGVKTLYIEPGSPWENGYCESLNSKLRGELHGATRGGSADRKLATTLQCCATAFLAELSTPGTRSDLAASFRSALGMDARRCEPGRRLRKSASVGAMGAHPLDQAGGCEPMNELFLSEVQPRCPSSPLSVSDTLAAARYAGCTIASGSPLAPRAMGPNH